jgi:hypothetical protein
VSRPKRVGLWGGKEAPRGDGRTCPRCGSAVEQRPRHKSLGGYAAVEPGGPVRGRLGSGHTPRYPNGYSAIPLPGRGLTFIREDGTVARMWADPEGPENGWILHAPRCPGEGENGSR